MERDDMGHNCFLRLLEADGLPQLHPSSFHYRDANLPLTRAAREGSMSRDSLEHKNQQTQEHTPEGGKWETGCLTRQKQQ